MWYRVLKAAQYLGVPPWELENQPLRYVHQAEEASRLEGLDTEATTPPDQPDE